MREAIVLATPVFFLLIAIELMVERRRTRRAVRHASGLAPYGPTRGGSAALADPRAARDYRFWDTVCNLACGSGQQVLGVFLLPLVIWTYEAVRVRFGLFALDAASPLVWGGTFLGVDCLYYWFHRSSHRVNLFWAAHAVHHQSEHYNQGVALRQSWLQQVFSFGFYLPLAVLGVPASVYLTCVAADTLYQFWIHTRLIQRMGPLEAVLNTPSHHRVHHGVEDAYLDRNHAGVLIVWDRLFGTFEPEAAEPSYGTVKPLRSVNPVWANLEPYVELWRRAGRMPRLWDRVQLWVRPPEWKGVGELPAPGPLRTDADYTLYEPAPSVGRALYGAVSFAVVLGMLLLLLGGTLSGPSCPPGLEAAVGVWILFSLGTLGGLAEQRPWFQGAELTRWVLLAALFAWRVALV